MNRHRARSAPSGLMPRIGTALLCAFTVTLIAGVLVWGFIGRQWFANRDLEEAVGRQGIASVTAINYPIASRGNPNPSYTVRLRLDGREVEAATWEPVRIGEVVRVDYRVGKSGAVYVNRIQPTGARR